jgi:hypothetical protein
MDTLLEEKLKEIEQQIAEDEKSTADRHALELAIENAKNASDLAKAQKALVAFLK